MSYPASLRQQAAWVREALDPATPDTQRITLCDVDVEELEAAAARIEALEAALDRAVTRGLEQVQRTVELEAQLRADTNLFKRTNTRIEALEAALREISETASFAALAPEQDNS